LPRCDNAERAYSGSNDAQKSMGLIWLMLISAGATSRDHLPFWVVASCYTAMALGTLLGGWRIIKTMGQCITELNLLVASLQNPAGR